MTNPTNPNYAMMAGVMNKIKFLREFYISISIWVVCMILNNANRLVGIRTNAKWKNTDSHNSQLIQAGNVISRIGHQKVGLTKSTKITIAHARIDGESFAVKLFKILE